MMSIGYKNTRIASSSNSSASRSTSKTTSNIWKVRTPSNSSSTQPRKIQQQAVQDALLRKQRVAAAGLKKAHARPLTGKIIAIRVSNPQPASARKQLLKPSLAPSKTKCKPKHDPRAQDAARAAALKLKQHVKIAHPGSKSPVRSVVRLDALGNQRIVLIMQRVVVQEALEKSPRVVTSDLRISPDGRQTNMLRFDKTFYGNALVNGAADQLGAIDLSGVSTEEQLHDCASMLFGIDISAHSPPNKFADHIPLQPINLDEDDEDDEPDTLFADDDEPASLHRQNCTNEFLAWNSVFNTPPPTCQPTLPPAPAVFSTAVRSGRMSDWHRGAKRYTPYASARPRRIAVA